MAEERVQRRLAAILAADVVGYSRLMGSDEAGTLAELTAHRAELIDPCIAEHRGRMFKTTGDGLLAEFASVVDAVECAVAFQEGMIQRNANTPDDRRIEIRIGINLGDVIVQDNDLFGDGVNIAARLEGLAEPNGICISETVHQNIRSKLELSFDDLGPQRVKNIGDPIHAFHIRPRALAEPDPTPEDVPSLPDKPSIAVLPFENMSADPEQEYFSDGITEDIITELSKLSGLFVIARHSAFTYKGKSVTLKQVGRELGVRYVLEGSVRKAGNRLRITAQLIDALSDHHIWAERYDRDLEDIFAVQDEVARNVAVALEVALMPGESERLAQTPTENLEAYDAYLRARKAPWPPSRHNLRSARNAFERVIEMDPAFAGGYAGKSLTYSFATLYGSGDDRDTDTEIAMELAQRAVELDQGFGRSYSALAFAYSAAGRHEEAVANARRAVELQPGDADSHAYYSRCLREAGLGVEACDEILIALRLDPHFVDGPYLNMLGSGSFIAGRYEDAIEAYERNTAHGGPTGAPNLLNWAAACGITGRLEEARKLVHEVLSEHPSLSLANVQDVRTGFSDLDLERLRDGLRKAGLPE
jgi:adenylate cyclase